MGGGIGDARTADKRIWWAVATLVAAFAALAVFVPSGRIQPWEEAVYAGASALHAPWLTSIVLAVTWLGDVNGLLLAVVAALLTPGRAKAGLPAALSMAVSVGLGQLLKDGFARPRPTVLHLVEAGGYSFPSRHAMATMALYLVLALALWRAGRSRGWLRAVAVLVGLLPIAVGLSRVYLGVHFAGDVLCGWLMGAAVALTVWQVWPRLWGRPL